MIKQLDVWINGVKMQKDLESIRMNITRTQKELAMEARVVASLTELAKLRRG